ncbi:MAG TPA: uroporphyrinogen-III synthase [Erythrobacter sp.]|nr:uroporphyrinogen-III synthase [Erythrobacter sp.]
MSLRIFSIRPEPGLSTTIKTGAEMGLPIIGMPLAQIAPRGWTMPALDDIDGLLIGSANAIRHAGEKLEALKELPVLAVGSKTAELARESGFRVEMIGSGGLQQLIDMLDPSKERHLLRLAGHAHVELNIPDHINLTTRIVYHVEHTDIAAEKAGLIDQECTILLHSAGAALHLVQETERLGIDRSKITLVTLGPRISESAGTGWAEVYTASNPDERTLLALARDMCQD